MKYWFLYNILSIIWSVYLIIIHISQKDHWLFQALLVVLWMVAILQSADKFSFKKSEILLHSVISFTAITGGHMVFSMFF